MGVEARPSSVLNRKLILKPQSIPLYYTNKWEYGTGLQNDCSPVDLNADKLFVCSWSQCNVILQLIFFYSHPLLLLLCLSLLLIQVLSYPTVMIQVCRSLALKSVTRVTLLEVPSRMAATKVTPCTAVVHSSAWLGREGHGTTTSHPVSVILSQCVYVQSYFLVLAILSSSLCLSLCPPLTLLLWQLILLFRAGTVNIAQLGVNPKDLSLHDFYLIALCWKKKGCLLFCNKQLWCFIVNHWSLCVFLMQN